MGFLEQLCSAVILGLKWSNTNLLTYFSHQPYRSCRVDNEELKTRDWKTRERIGYGKPIKPKQLTHF